MKIETGFETKKARVEMLPLIDVVFLLLVFFIYAFISMAVHHGIAVDLPEVGNAELQTNEQVVISVDNKNQIFVNKKPVSEASLLSEIQQIEGYKNLPISINGDDSADLGIAVRILEKLQSAGIKKVSFACTID